MQTKTQLISIFSFSFYKIQFNECLIFGINLPLWIWPRKADSHAERWILTFYLSNKLQDPEILKMCISADILELGRVRNEDGMFLNLLVAVLLGVRRSGNKI